MSMSDGTSPSERLTLQSLLGSQVYSLLVLAANIAFGAAALGALWLIASLLFGHYGEFATLGATEKKAVLNNIHLATMLLTIGMGAGSLMAAVAYFGEEIIGYILLGGAALLGLGIPYGFQQFGGEGLAATKSVALTQVYGGFLSATLLPAIIGGLLIVYDVVTRLIKTVRERPTVAVEKMSYGTGAKKETNDRPPRTSILGKCWEGPYCREFIRPHCPIFLKRQACWKQRKGCYCEEDIVSAAVSKVTGPSLPMANSGGSRFSNMPPPTSSGGGFHAVPDPTLSGFSSIGTSPSIGHDPMGTPGMTPPPPGGMAQVARKIELTGAQKAERCRSCVIYNEHQREKYQVLVPVVIVGTIAACIFFAIQFHGNMGAVVTGLESIINRFSFLPGNNKVTIGESSSAVAWVLIGAGTIMVIAKMLQFLEWCVFKIKI